MSEGIFTIELGRYGFMLDTEWAYVSLSWPLLILSALSATIYTIVKRMRSK